MIKRYSLLVLFWLVSTITFGLLISAGGCTSYHVEQNSNNGDTCKKGIGNYSIFGDHTCSIESDNPKETKQESVEK